MSELRESSRSQTQRSDYVNSHNTQRPLHQIYHNKADEDSNTVKQVLPGSDGFPRLSAFVLSGDKDVGGGSGAIHHLLVTDPHHQRSHRFRSVGSTQLRLLKASPNRYTLIANDSNLLAIGPIWCPLAAHLLSYVNSCINPVVYGFMSKNFRASFKTALSKCLHCKGNGQSSSNRGYTSTYRINSTTATRATTIWNHQR